VYVGDMVVPARYVGMLGKDVTAGRKKLSTASMHEER
jgi:hypothetical protein